MPTLTTKKTFGIKTIPVTIRFFETLWKEVQDYAKHEGQSNNNAVNILVRERLEQLKQKGITPYSIIHDKETGRYYVAMYDFKKEKITTVYLSDMDDEIQFTCDSDIGADNCEHIIFVKNIPPINEWVAEDEEEKRAEGGSD